jgi:hypothetical protein
MSPEQQPTLVVRIALPPVWNQIEPLQSYVQTATKMHVPTLAERTAIVVQELLENAVKYGDPGRSIDFWLQIPSGRRGVELSVSNHAHPRRIALLQQELDAFGPNPKDTLARAVQRLPRLPQGVSMLGLARIMSEAVVVLKVEADLVTVNATIQ